MTLSSSFRFSRISFLILLICFFAGLQAPFISADPDKHISGSRGPHTDEGLNTAQIRNFINHGKLGLEQSDNLIKTPLFSAILYPSFKVFGTKLEVARVTVLAFSLLALFLLFKRSTYLQLWGIITFLIGFMQYHLFHFFHFSLAEILSTIAIFAAIIFASNQDSKSKFPVHILWACICIFISYALKIQFLYAIILLPMVLILRAVFFKDDRKLHLKHFAYSVILSTILLGLYILFWYLPHREFMDYVMSDQTDNRFASLSKLPDRISYVLKGRFHNSFNSYFSWSFYIAFIVGLFLLLSKSSSNYKFLFICLSSWLLLECHKLGMTYLPTRYLISTFFVMALIISLVLTEIWLRYEIRKTSVILKILLGLAFLFLISFSAMKYLKSYSDREYSILEANEFLEKSGLRPKTMMGAWAPSLSWKSGALAMPIWNDYFNDVDVIPKFSPRVIIQEKGEKDSNQAFSSKGIDLREIADSISSIKIHKWDLEVFWIAE